MKTPLFVALIMALALAAGAQQTEPPQTAGEQPTSPPETLEGQRPRRELLSERSTPNYMSAGIAISQLFTDNALLSTGHKISNLSYSIEPRIAFDYSKPRLSYSLSVLAGFIVNRTLEGQNQATQSVGLDLSYGVRPFTTLRLSDSFTNSTGLWSGSGAFPPSHSGGGVGVVDQPNSAVFTYGRFRTNTALAELSHQFTLRDIGGTRFTQSYTWFPDTAVVPGLGALYGGQTYSAEAFYNHQFSSGQWAGVTLRGQRFDIDRLTGRTDTATLLFLYAINARPNVSLSLFAGPQLSNPSAPGGSPLLHPQFSSRMWSPVMGAVFNWRRPRTTSTVTASHQVSDGSGLPSAVTLTAVDIAVLRQLTRSLGVDVGFAHTQSVPIVEGQTVRTYSGRLQFTYRFNNNCALGAGYARDDNTYVQSHRTASANRTWISFSYDFSRPLGR